MSMKTTNAKCREFVQMRVEFTGSNLLAECHGENYFVFSYGHHWILFAYVDGVWYENDERYSMSTSKHRSQCHPHVDTVKLSKIDIHKMY